MKNTKAAHKIFATCILAASLLAACGGGAPAECPPNAHPAFCAARPGGGGAVDDPAASAGLWEGSTSNGRETFGAVLSDGSYWFFYTALTSAFLIAGVNEGTAISAGGTLTSVNGRDYNLEGRGVDEMTLTANFVPQTSLNGAIRYTDETVSFTTSHVTYAAASLSQLAGSYRGEAAVAGASQTEPISVTISASGIVSGSAQSGCNFSGSAAARTDVAAVFDLTVTFRGGACALGASTVRGIVIYDTSSQTFLSAAVNAGRTNAFIAAGVKQ